MPGGCQRGPDRGLVSGIWILGSRSSQTWGQAQTFSSHSPPPIRQPDISRLREGKAWAKVTRIRDESGRGWPTSNWEVRICQEEAGHYFWRQFLHVLEGERT